MTPESLTVGSGASRAKRRAAELPAVAAALLTALLAVTCAGPGTPPLSVAPSGVPAPPRSPATATPRVVALAYGGSFCALREDGRIVCWGRNFASSLGDGTHEARSEPALLAGLDGVREIRGLSPYGFCALRSDASLWCWGFGYTGDATTPAAGVTPHLVAREVSAFGFPERFPGVCVRHGDGRTSCTELRASERQGCSVWADEAQSSCLAWRAGVKESPRSVSEAGSVTWGGSPRRQGYPPRCVLENGSVRCGGDNSAGAIGDPSRRQADTPVPVPGMTDVLSLAQSGTAACVVRADGSAWCWGRNAQGELIVPPDPRPCTSGGVATGCNRVPTRLPVQDVAQVVLGWRMFVVTRAGILLASRREGPSVETAANILEPVAGIPPVATVVAGNLAPHVACAVTKGGEVYCLGNGADLGDRSPQVSRVPVRIASVADAAQVQVDITSACAALNDGTVSCWGDPTAPRGLRDIAAVAPPCALARDGRVWCWGHNLDGEMGLGVRGRPGIDRDKEIVHLPRPVPALSGIRQISSHQGTTCALDARGTVRCWGPWGPRSPTLSPTEIRGLPPIDQIWTVWHRQCGLTRDRQMWCWRTGSSAAPVTEWGRPARLPSHGSGAESKKEICVIDTNASARCIGTAAQPAGLIGVRQLSLAPERPTQVFRGCAVLESGDLRCWGPPHCPMRAALCGGGPWNTVTTVLREVRQVSVGSYLSCAVRADGTVWCWGQGGLGGLGEPFPPRDQLIRVDLDRLDAVTAPVDR